LNDSTPSTGGGEVPRAEGSTPRKATIGGRVRAAIAAIGRTGTRWLRAADVGLERAEQAVLLALLDRVDHGTWCVPTRWHHGEGVSVERLGELCGYRRRRTFWAIRNLERRGLIQVDRRPPRTSQYKLIHERILALAEVHRSRLEQWELGQELERARRWGQVVLDAAVALLPESLKAPLEKTEGAEAEADSAAASTPAEGELPRWAFTTAKKANLGETQDVAELVYTLTAGCAREVLGESMHPDRFGGMAGRAVALWESQGRPTPGALVADLRSIVAAVQSAPGPVWAHARGERSDRRDRAPKDRRGDLAWFLRPATFTRLLAEARRAALRVVPMPQTCSTAAPPLSPADIERLTIRIALPDDLTPEQVSPDELAKRFASWSRRLRSTPLGALAETWLGPLKLSHVEDDTALVLAPSPVFLTFLSEREESYRGLLTEAARELRMPLLVTVRGPPDS
jgi:hypothetical protein